MWRAPTDVRVELDNIRKAALESPLATAAFIVSVAAFAVSVCLDC
jgi:hypothetical protein